MEKKNFFRWIDINEKVAFETTLLETFPRVFIAG